MDLNVQQRFEHNVGKLAFAADGLLTLWDLNKKQSRQTVNLDEEFENLRRAVRLFIRKPSNEPRS